MVPASAGVIKIDRTPELAAIRLSVLSRHPSCFLPLWQALKDHQVGLTPAAFKLLPLCLNLERVKLFWVF